MTLAKKLTCTCPPDLMGGHLSSCSEANESPSGYAACPTHCCVVHGCKYGYDKCPVYTKDIQPVYPNNNGCEDCEDVPSVTEVDRITVRQDVGGPYPVYKEVTLLLMSDQTVRWSKPT